MQLTTLWSTHVYIQMLSLYTMCLCTDEIIKTAFYTMHNQLLNLYPKQPEKLKESILFRHKYDVLFINSHSRPLRLVKNRLTKYT